MDKTTVNGVDIEYEVKGSGEPVLLIDPGPIADSFLPFFVRKALVERYRLIRYRQRRWDGKTPVSFAEHAAEAAGLLERLEIRRVHVAGHSTGAAIGLQLAIDRPDLVHTLALLEPPLFAVPSASAFLEKVGPAVEAYNSYELDLAMKRFLSVACSLDWETCRATIEAAIPGGVEGTLKNADNFFGSYLPALTAWQFGAAEAARISSPVLSVVGTGTERLFAEGQQLLQSWFPNIEDCIIEGAAHLLHMQRPQSVAVGIAEFLSRHPMNESRLGTRGAAEVGGR